MRFKAVLLLAMTSCATAPATSPIGLDPRDLPPRTGVRPAHSIDLGFGGWSCESGYFPKDGQCIPFSELPSGTQMEISPPNTWCVGTCGGAGGSSGDWDKDLRGCCSYHRGVRGCSGGIVICNDGAASPTCTC